MHMLLYITITFLFFQGKDIQILYVRMHGFRLTIRSVLDRNVMLIPVNKYFLTR